MRVGSQSGHLTNRAKLRYDEDMMSLSLNNVAKLE